MTPQEIIKAMRGGPVATPALMDEAADLIESLLKDVDSEHLAGAQAVAEVARLKSYCLKQAVEFGDRLEIVKAELAQVKRERDAAVEDLREMTCRTCRFRENESWEKPCRVCTSGDLWEWRGVQEGGAEDGKR